MSKRRKKWKDEDMEKVLEVVQKSQATVSGAAKQFDVPRKTLDDRVKGRVFHGTKSDHGTVLTSAEEDILCNYLNESLNSSNNVDASDSQKESSDKSEDEVPSSTLAMPDIGLSGEILPEESEADDSSVGSTCDESMAGKEVGSKEAGGKGAAVYGFCLVL